MVLSDSTSLSDCKGDCSLLSVCLVTSHRKVHILYRIHIVFLNQPDVFLLKFASQWRIFLWISSRMIELSLCAARCLQWVVVNDHVIGTTLHTTNSLLGLVWLARLRCLSEVLLQLLASGTHHLIVGLCIYNNLMGIVSIVPAIKDLILVLNLIVAR